MQTRTRIEKVALTDAELARAIKRRMKEDFEVPDDRIAIKVAEGFVTIAGTVVRDSQRNAAEDCVKKVKGVRGITNKIEVDPTLSLVEA
jgi:osmotically-inducible protein OsmY